MTEDTQDRHDARFWRGLLAGMAVGVGVALWLLPRAIAVLGKRPAASADTLCAPAVDQAPAATSRVEKAVAAASLALAR